MTTTIERPYQFETLETLGRRTTLPNPDKRVGEEVAIRLSNGPQTPKEQADHFIDFHVNAYKRNPGDRTRFELLAIMTGFETIARN